MNEITFQPFPKIARLSRDMIITEKLDGTNAQIIITDDGQIAAASRTRLITPEDDNFGFAAWVRDNSAELSKLGPGRHFGEWWGKGIQRGYGLNERRFSLFNTLRWYDGPAPTGVALTPAQVEKFAQCPACCTVVPVLATGPFDTDSIQGALYALAAYGSKAAPGFMRPEGIVIFHTHSGYLFKKTFEKDVEGKGNG